MSEIEASAVPRGAAVVIDSKGCIVGWNEGAEAVLGFAAVDVIGRVCHDVLCGLDPGGQVVCHPWCALSTGDARGNPDDDVVLYPRSAAHEIVRIILSALRVGGADGTPRWLVHTIRSAKPIVIKPRTRWTADPAGARRRLVKKPTPPENTQH